MSLFEIKCPMCKGTIWVNPSTGEVVDHKAIDHQKADLGEFLKTQKQRGNILEDKFKKAKQDVDKRKEDLDKKFKEAGKHAEDYKEDLRSPYDWD